MLPELSNLIFVKQTKIVEILKIHRGYKNMDKSVPDLVPDANLYSSTDDILIIVFVIVPDRILKWTPSSGLKEKCCFEEI